LNGIVKDTNSTQEAVCLDLTKEKVAGSLQWSI